MKTKVKLTEHLKLSELYTLFQNVLSERDQRLVNATTITNHIRESSVLFLLITSRDHFDDSSQQVQYWLDNMYTILTKRSLEMKHNPGDMAFPGGSREDHDKSIYETAQRETMEEVGIESEKYSLLGYLDEFNSLNKYIVKVCLAKMMVDVPKDNLRDFLEKNYQPKSNENIFTLALPISYFLNPEHYSNSQYKLEGGRIGYIRYFDLSEYKSGETVWGLTASMIRRFIDTFIEDHQLPIEPNS